MQLLSQLIGNEHSLILQQNESKGMTKRSYMEAVIDGIRAVDTVDVAFVASSTNDLPHINAITANGIGSATKRKRIYVRLLLSIDRREMTAAALETVLPADFCLILYHLIYYSI